MSPLAAFRGVVALSAFPGPVGELCFLFFEASFSAFPFLFVDDSSDRRRAYALYFAARSQVTRFSKGSTITQLPTPWADSNKTYQFLGSV